MGTPASDRQRRSRAHRKGDHSLCDPQRCDGDPPVTEPVTGGAEPSTRTPALGTRGRRMWREVTADGALKPTELVTLEEACRITDRLDVLNKLLAGDEGTWLRLAPLLEDGHIVEVRVQGVLAEARQQQMTLARLLSELRQSRAGTAGTARPATGPPPPSAGGGGNAPAGVGDLTSRIAAKRSAQATG